MTEDKYIITETLPYSGYTISILPLPPHYMDVIEELYPLQEYPKRKITLLAGDVVFVPYEPPEEPPGKDVDPEGYDLYYQWHSTDTYNLTIRNIRNKARVDLLYSLCVTVVDGQYKIEDNGWVEDLEAAFIEDNVKLDLSHPGYRKLMFIKTQVIRHIQEKNIVTQIAMYEEVGMQGIESALHGFRTAMGQHSPSGSN